MCDVVARVTKGRPFPRFGDEAEERAPKGSALILSQEEDISLIVRPRLEAAGANIKHVYTPGYEPAPGDANYFDLLDRLDTKANEIEALITKIGDVQLVSVDPITDYVGKIDMYRDDQVRTLLKPFARIAARHNLAFVIILHLNKKSDMAARYRGMGSIAFRNVARSSVLVANSVEQEGRRLMMLEKKNLTRYCYSVAFTTRNARGQPRIAWEREWIEANVDDVLNGKGPTKQKKAADLLREWLKDGPMSATEIQELAQAQGISKRTLALAKAVVGAISVKNPDKTWSWKLPDAKGKQDDNEA
jgi:putative DNA primase/helicase